MKILFRVIPLILIALFMSNCADKPTHLELVVKSGDRLNPNKNDIPSPLMLNFYELKTADQFTKLDFWALSDEAKKRLDSDLISQSKHVIIPSEEQTYKILFDENTKYFGVVGSFRNIDSNATWRLLKPLKTKKYNHLEIFIDNNTIKEIEQ